MAPGSIGARAPGNCSRVTAVHAPPRFDIAARVATVALGVLGVLGAMLAITGIFGMASYVVSKRLRELGIRVALGANQRQVLHASLGRAFRLLAIGSGSRLVPGPGG